MYTCDVCGGWCWVGSFTRKANKNRLRAGYPSRNVSGFAEKAHVESCEHVAFFFVPFIF